MEKQAREFDSGLPLEISVAAVEIAKSRCASLIILSAWTSFQEHRSKLYLNVAAAYHDLRTAEP